MEAGPSVTVPSSAKAPLLKRTGQLPFPSLRMRWVLRQGLFYFLDANFIDSISEAEDQVCLFSFEVVSRGIHDGRGFLPLVILALRHDISEEWRDVLLIGVLLPGRAFFHDSLNLPHDCLVQIGQSMVDPYGMNLVENPHVSVLVDIIKDVELKAVVFQLANDHRVSVADGRDVLESGEGLLHLLQTNLVQLSHMRILRVEVVEVELEMKLAAVAVFAGKVISTFVVTGWDVLKHGLEAELALLAVTY
eukprot:CAMPEP_0170485370 /NCGR_PEP_ID=MMETSP0208-20121228/4658_1 /TAXON_ID=197538 /ORGANISM="Strombidium inclinatum, Strain S3" /LENGTH=247 /DNA_ID=CAMNT_0010759003 /DNA_START=180 /DNA_END=924 /DNA_ORIENTATION=-